MPRPPTDTKERLVEAAVHLFAEHGYHATGLAEILAKAQANSGSFYFYFRGKEDLLVAVLKWYQEHLDPILLARVREQTREPIERIFALLGLYRASIAMTEFAFGCPLGRLGLEMDAQLHPIHDEIAINYTGWKLAVERFIREAAPSLRPDVNAKQLATLVLSVMEGAVMQSRSYRSFEPFDQSIEELRKHFSLLQLKSEKKKRNHHDKADVRRMRTAPSKRTAGAKPKSKSKPSQRPRQAKGR